MELLKSYGSLQGIYDNLDKIAKAGCPETGARATEQAFLSKQLIALKDDCAIDVTRDTLTFPRPRRRKLSLRGQLGFTRQLGLLRAEPNPPPAQLAEPCQLLAQARENRR